MSETETKILALLDKIRPYLVSDGGNVEYVKFEDGIEELIVSEIDEVKEVKLA